MTDRSDVEKEAGSLTDANIKIVPDDTTLAKEMAVVKKLKELPVPPKFDEPFDRKAIGKLNADQKWPVNPMRADAIALKHRRTQLVEKSKETGTKIYPPKAPWDDVQDAPVSDEFLKTYSDFSSVKDVRDVKDSLGVCFSGGGVRSASFCGGCLEAFAEWGWLPYVDYVSTVSGGGYIGSAFISKLTAHLACKPGQRKNYPPVTVLDKDVASETMTFMHRKADYLTPVWVRKLTCGAARYIGAAFWALIAIGCMTLKPLLYLASAFPLSFFLDYLFGDFMRVVFLTRSFNAAPPPLSVVVFAYIGAASIIGLIYFRIFGICARSGSITRSIAQAIKAMAALWLNFGLILGITLGTEIGAAELRECDQLTCHVTEAELYALTVAYLGALFSIVIVLQLLRTLKLPIPRLFVGLCMVAFRFFTIFVQASTSYLRIFGEWREGFPTVEPYWNRFFVAVVFLMLIGFGFDRVWREALHLWYRFHLQAAFFQKPHQIRALTKPARFFTIGPYSCANRSQKDWSFMDLHDAALKTPVPLWLCNATLNDYERPGDAEDYSAFVFTSYYYGSVRTGYTTHSPDFDVARGMGLSAAAVSLGVGKSWFSSFARYILYVLSLNLGGWINFPTAQHSSRKFWKYAHPIIFGTHLITWYGYRSTGEGFAIPNAIGMALYFFITVFGLVIPKYGHFFTASALTRDYLASLQLNTEITGRTVAGLAKGSLNVSDGGHFENLGILPLLARRVKTIIAFDGEVDKSRTAENLMRVFRASECTSYLLETGTSCTIESIDNGHDGETLEQRCKAFSEVPDEGSDGVMTFKIKYLDAKGNFVSEGHLFFCLLRRVTGFLHAPQGVTEAFPYDSTAAQWYSKAMFDSYRQLGRHIGRSLAEKTFNPYRVHLASLPAGPSLRQVDFEARHKSAMKIESGETGSGSSKDPIKDHYDSASAFEAGFEIGTGGRKGSVESVNVNVDSSGNVNEEEKTTKL